MDRVALEQVFPTNIPVFWTDVLLSPSGLKYISDKCGRLYTYVTSKVHGRWPGDQSGQREQSTGNARIQKVHRILSYEWYGKEKRQGWQQMAICKWDITLGVPLQPPYIPITFVPYSLWHWIYFQCIFLRVKTSNLTTIKTEERMARLFITKYNRWTCSWMKHLHKLQRKNVKPHFTVQMKRTKNA